MLAGRVVLAALTLALIPALFGFNVDSSVVWDSASIPACFVGAGWLAVCIVSDCSIDSCIVVTFASIPGCLKKFLSSADKKAYIIFFGICSYFIKDLLCLEKSAIISPLEL